MRRLSGIILSITFGACLVAGCSGGESGQVATRSPEEQTEYPPPQTSITVQREGLRTAGDSEAVKKPAPTTAVRQANASADAPADDSKTRPSRRTRRARQSDSGSSSSADDQTPVLVEPRDAKPAGWDDDDQDPTRRIVRGLSRSEMQSLLQGRITTREVAKRIRYTGSERRLTEAIKQIQRDSSNRWRDDRP